MLLPLIVTLMTLSTTPPTAFHDQGWTVELRGRGCCSGNTPPTLSATPTSVSSHSIEVGFSGGGAPRDQAGWLLVGPLADAPLLLDNGQHMTLDPHSSVVLQPLTSSHDGDWQTRGTLPATALQPTIRLIAQGVFLDPQMSLGFALTDAIEMTLTP